MTKDNNGKSTVYRNFCFQQKDCIGWIKLDSESRIQDVICIEQKI